MMAEIEREMALAAFQQKLEDERAAAAAATAAYRASLEDEVIGEVVVEDEVIEVTEAAHEACKYALGLSDANTALIRISIWLMEVYLIKVLRVLTELNLVLQDGMHMQIA